MAKAAGIKLGIPIPVTATDVVIDVVAIDYNAIWVTSAILIQFFIFTQHFFIIYSVSFIVISIFDHIIFVNKFFFS